MMSLSSLVKDIFPFWLSIIRQRLTFSGDVFNQSQNHGKGFPTSSG